jgi:hypothetical protein
MQERTVVVTVTYETSEHRADVLARVAEALRQHADAGYELVELAVTEVPSGYRRNPPAAIFTDRVTE